MTEQVKILFLVFHGFAEHNGISKKIWGQIKGLRDAGPIVDLCSYEVMREGNRGWFINGKPLVLFGRTLFGKIKRRFAYQALASYIDRQNYDLIYIRSDHNANPFTIRFLRLLRKKKSRIVMEIPTYPYDGEYRGWRMQFELAVDKLYRKKFASLLDGIVTFSDEKSIFGQKTYRISNGIDLSAVKIRTPRKNINNDHLNIIAVAEFHFWHGIDRAIRGLACYMKKSVGPRIFLHMVGSFTDPNENLEIQSLIKNLGLQDNVLLYGNQWGEDLDRLFDQADFAIGSLGRHRSGVTTIKTLKNREYAARGIPFVYSEQDSDFDGMPYVLKAPPDESPLNFVSIVNFLADYTFSAQQIRNSIRYLDWSQQMRSLLKSLDVHIDNEC